MKKLFINKKNIYYYNIQHNKRKFIFHTLGLNLKKKMFYLKTKHTYFLQNRNNSLTENKETLAKSNDFFNKIKKIKLTNLIFVFVFFYIIFFFYHSYFIIYTLYINDKNFFCF